MMSEKMTAPPRIIGVIVSEENGPTPAGFTVQLLKDSESQLRVGDFLVTEGNPRLLASVGNIIPQHLYFKMPLLVGSSLREGFELSEEAPPSSSWTLAKAFEKEGYDCWVATQKLFLTTKHIQNQLYWSHFAVN